MNRYSPGHSVLSVSAFGAPLLPFLIYTRLYEDPQYFASPTEVLLLWFWGLLISLGMIAVHELGHALAAKLVGIGISEIVIGHWKKLVSFRVGSTRVVLRAAPSTGYVMPVASERHFSVPRMTVMLLAGVGAEIIVMVLTTMAPIDLRTPQTFGELVLIFTLICIYCFGCCHLVNLLPYESSIGGETFESDGLQILEIWKQRRDPSRREMFTELTAIDALIAAHDLPRATERAQAFVTRHPENINAASLVALLHSQQGNTHAAEAIWRKLLAGPGLSASKTAELLDSLSCLPLYHGRMDLLAEADRWSGEALNHVPAAITLKGTRGSILIELGRLEEGIAMLREVLKRSEETIDHAIGSAYLAKAYAAKGDHAEAARFLTAARKLDENHVVIKRISAELSPIVATSVPR